MTTYVSRKVQGILAPGFLTDVGRILYPEWSYDDVGPETVLKIGDGDGSWGHMEIEASGSEVLQLPPGYTDASRLFVFLRTNRTVKATIESPDHADSVGLVRGSPEFNGQLMVQDTVTSITLENQSSSDRALVRFFLFKMPDLTAPASYRGGADALGSSDEVT